MSRPTSRADRDEQSSLGSVIGRVAFALREQLSPGDLAELRRMDFSDPASPALWKVLTELVEPAGWLDASGARLDELERRWAVLLGAMAQAPGLHEPSHFFGSALADAGYSELRFVRLLRARDTQLFDELRRLASFMASKAVPLDWSGVASLLFFQEEPAAERTRRRIARSYYRSMHRNEQKESS